MSGVFDLPTRPASSESASHLVRTRYGIEFDARDDWWPIDGRQGIDAGAMRAIVSPGLLSGLELTMRDCARRYAAATMVQFHWALKHYQRSMFVGDQVASWRLIDFRNYRAVLAKEFGHEDYLRHIRSLLTNWQKAGHPGVTPKLAQSLADMRLKGAETGRAVRVMDPDKGPLRPDEFHHLLQSLNDAAEGGRLNLDDFSLAYLHLSTGRRPVQSAYLKCKDVVQRMGDSEPAFPQGRPLYLLAVPRAKQRGHGFRETRRAIDLTLENFLVFQAQRDNVQETFRSQLREQGWALQPHDLERLLVELPLYPAWPSVEAALREATELRTQGEHGRALESIRADAAGNAWHPSPRMQGTRVATVCRSVASISRDGTPLQVTASRLRYTKGTDLAREGIPAHLIAWLLDHSTSRSADIYIDNLPEHAAEISGGISKSVTMQRFASAFRGTLVDSEADARGGSDPLQSRLSYQGVGAATCGHLKQCGLDGGVPHACYTCSHFQPWLDGPHDAFLSDLLTERASAVAELGADSPVAKRRDKLIVAVENVIHLCRARRIEIQAAAADGEAN